MDLVSTLRERFAGSTFFLVEEIDMTEAEDGSPTVTIPIIGGASIMITPEPDSQDRWGVLVMTSAGALKVLAKNIERERLTHCVLRQLVPNAIRENL
jgi:hypothetical protein